MIPGLLAAMLLTVTPSMPLSISTTDDGLAIFANPAGLGAGHGTDFHYLYNFQSVPWSEFLVNNAFALNLGGLGFFWEPKPTRYGVGLGMGGKPVLGGIRYVRDTLGHWDLGAMVRPTRWLSLAAVWTDMNRDWGDLQVGAAVRPVGNRLTLFAESYLITPIQMVYGAEAEPLNGFVLACRVVPGSDLKSTNVSAGITVGLGRAGIGAVTTRYPGEVGGMLRVSSGRRRTFLPQGGKYIEVKLAEAVVDQRPGFSLMGGGPSRTTWQLLDLVRKATDDRSVRALVLELDGASMSFAQAQELRSGLEAFRAGGKRIYVYSSALGMLGYYVASVADKIIAHPLADIAIPGVSAQTMFLKGTLEKLGIGFDYTRHGKYKSAVEMFSEDSLTAANREQWQALVDDAYEDFVQAVSKGRRMSRDTLEVRIEHGFFMAPQAKAAGLVDTICYRDELDSCLRKDLSGLRRTSEAEYLGFNARRYDYDWQERPAVAVVYATGSIMRGESGTDFLTGSMSMGANTIVRAVKAARSNQRVRAIVLRVDSPGGDGFASDLIWREIELARKKKPVIVSMGGVAASGGYYVACNARRVFASPMTLTGSIGVFDYKFVTEGLYNKLGVKRQVVKRGEHADAMSDVRAFTPEEDSLMQDIVDGFYRQFVQKVAQGRNLSYERVDSAGQGRVWSGRAAKAEGIVDSLAGFMEAVDYAKREAHLKECDFVFYPKPRTDFLSRMGGFTRDQIMRVRYE